MKKHSPSVKYGFEKYGNFSKSGREFVISRPDTPKPWINYIWNSQILSEVDQRGRGYCQYRSSDGERTNLVKDRIIYVLDLDNVNYWTIGWDPSKHKYDMFECHHGLGYSCIETCVNGIYSSFTITCAQNDPVEMWQIVLRNNSEYTRRVTLCPYAEFDLSGAEVYGGLENSIYAQVDTDRKTVLAINGCKSREGYKNNSFLRTDRVPAAVQTSKRSFVGGAYETLENPLSLINGMFGNSNASNEPLIAALSYPYDLAAGEEVAIHIVIGPFENPDEISGLCARHMGENGFKSALAGWEEHIKTYDNVNISLPDRYLQPLFNIWTKHQLALLMDYSRGWTMGIRDTLQDAQAFCSLDPEKAKDIILKAAAHQLNNGHFLRGYWPLDLHDYADGGIWFVLTVTDYIKETGDFSILNEVVENYDGVSSTIYDHMKQGIDCIYSGLGSHGLALARFGDWNDSLNIGVNGKGQSVWLSMAFVVAAKELSNLSLQIELLKDAGYYSDAASTISQNIEKYCWDGEWYIRGFTDDGDPVGSRVCEEGKIFAEPQTWATFAELDKSRIERVEESMQKHLMTDYGLLVCNPAYTKYDPALGRITTIPAGWGENGSAYCHVSAFKAVADCMRRDGDAALDTLSRIIASNPRCDIDSTAIEPFGYTNMFRGPQHPQSPRSLRSWFSGTVGWVYRCVTQWMIGVRPTYEGLIIDPVLPKEWDSVSMTRHYRGATYKINIMAVENVQGSECQVFVDDRKICGNLIKVEDYSGTHRIDVYVGNHREALHIDANELLTEATYRDSIKTT